MKSLEFYDGKIIIVTFEMPVTTNEKKMDNCILINWISNYFWNIEIYDQKKFQELLSLSTQKKTQKKKAMETFANAKT
jgi:hypothetical protein